jgi:hypothetical protein
MDGDPSPSGQTGTEDFEIDWPQSQGVDCHSEGDVPNAALDHCIESIWEMLPTDLADTMVERLQSGDLTPQSNPITIDIELVSLSLVSVAPLHVSGCNAGAGADFLLGVTLDGIQGGGQLQLNAQEFFNGTDLAIGEASIDMEVNYKIQFEEIGNPGNAPVIGGLSGQIVAAGGQFQAGPKVGAPAIAGWGLVLVSGMMLALIHVGRRALAASSQI